MDITQLYNRAGAGNLGAQDLAWLKSQAQKYPYFALSHIVLAKNHFDQLGQSGDLLQKASAYSANRSLLKDYMYSVKVVPTMEPVTKDFKPSEQAKAGPKKIVDVTKEKEAGGETLVGKKNDGETGSSESLTPEPVPAKSSNKKKISKPGLGGARIGQVNWFLQMRVKIRSEKYNGMESKLRSSLLPVGGNEQAEEKVLSNETKEANPASVVVPISNLVKTKEPKLGITNPDLTRDKKIVKENNTSSAETVVSDKKEKGISEKVAPLKASSIGSKPEVTDRKGPSSTFKSRRSEQQKVVVKAESVSVEKTIAIEHTGYEIGSFSNFSFVEDSDGQVGAETEIEEKVSPAESIAIQALDPGLGAGSELIIEEDDRRLEIVVTPEELAKYFNGELPKSTHEHAEKGNFDFDFSEFSISSEGAGNQSGSKDLRVSTPPVSVEFETRDFTIDFQQEDSQSKRDLLDDFIENEPSISRNSISKSKKGDLSKRSVVEKDDWVTETLAKIFLMQGNKVKALDIYEKLALQFPEKRAYFDDQILKLKK